MNTIKTPLKEYGNIYGPYAFGVTSLLIIWFSIVKPELNQRALDFEQQSEILKQMATRDQAQAQTAQSLNVTALVLERIVNRLDNEQ